MTVTPQIRRSAAEQQRLESLLQEMFEHRISFNEVLGLKVTSFAPAAPQLKFAMRPELVGHYLYGRLHGGVIAAALDTVGGFAAVVGIAEKFCGETAEQVAHRFGRIVRLGGRIASIQMTLENESGLLIATGSAAYVVS